MNYNKMFLIYVFAVICMNVCFSAHAMNNFEKMLQSYENSRTENELIFIAATETGDLETVKKYYANNVSLDTKDFAGRKGLHISAGAGKLNIVKFFIEHNFPINNQSSATWTALHYAVDARRKDVVEYLINKDADINAQTRTNITPLHFAVIEHNNVQCKFCPDIIKILLSNDARYDIKDKTKETALFIAQKNNDIKKLFDEIIAYKKAVDENKKAAALVNAITHNDNNDSAFNKEQWIRLALLRKDHKQLFYALDEKAITVDDVVKLIASVPRMPLDFITQLLSENTIVFKDLKQYYDLAKQEDNKKFGKYYVKLQKLFGKESAKFPKELYQKIVLFLPIEEKPEVKDIEMKDIN